MSGRIRTAKDGKDAELDGSEDMTLDTDLLLPKLYMVKVLSPVSEYDTVTYTHGLGYAPMYLHYEEAFDNSALGTVFTPARWTWAPQNNPLITNMSTTEYTATSRRRDSYLLLFLDPLAEPATAPDATTHNWGRIRIGEDTSDSDYKQRLDTKYQTLKVAQQGDLVFNLPAWAAPALTAQDDYGSVAHDLGYPPAFAPFGVSAVGVGLNLLYDGDLTDIPTTLNFNEINDTMVERWAYALTFSTNYPETLFLYVDEDKLYIRCRRQNNDFSGSVNFPARTITVKYTIFSTPIDEEFDILTD